MEKELSQVEFRMEFPLPTPEEKLEDLNAAAAIVGAPIFYSGPACNAERKVKPNRNNMHLLPQLRKDYELKINRVESQMTVEEPLTLVGAG